MLFRKYNLDWRYGISELAIVVSGVLIALAADGWVTNRSELSLETRYLEELKIDIQSDLNAIEDALAIAESRAQYGHAIIDYLDEKTQLSARDLAIFAERSMFFTFPAYSTSTISDLTSTGNLGLIRNIELRRTISEYYLNLERESQWAENWRLIQRRLEGLLPDVLRIKQREGIAGDGKSGIPWAANLVVSESEAGEIFQRMQEHSDYQSALEGMIRVQGSLHISLSRIFEEGSVVIAEIELELN